MGQWTAQMNSVTAVAVFAFLEVEEETGSAIESVVVHAQCGRERLSIRHSPPPILPWKNARAVRGKPWWIPEVGLRCQAMNRYVSVSLASALVSGGCAAGAVRIMDSSTDVDQRLAHAQWIVLPLHSLSLFPRIIVVSPFSL